MTGNDRSSAELQHNRQGIGNRVVRIWPFLGPVIGLVGISLALYFHAQAVQERTPTYYVSPQRAVIVDATAPGLSELQILHRGQPVGNSVVAVTLYFWNDGRLPIRRADVLEPVAVQIAAGAEILEARIQKVSRPVVKFSTGEVPSDARNFLPIDFEILEKGDGAALQMIYAGTPDARIDVTGTIVGAGDPRILSTSTSSQFFKRSDPKASRRRQMILGSVAVFMGGLMFVGVLVLWIRTRLVADLERRRSRRWRLALLLVFSLFYTGLGITMLYITYRAFSPGVPGSIWIEP
jgi:hypothetical protein